MSNARRDWIGTAGGLALALAVRPARAVSTDTLQEVIKRWAGGQPVQVGRVTLDIAPLVENGNAVPIQIEEHTSEL